MGRSYPLVIAVVLQLASCAIATAASVAPQLIVVYNASTVAFPAYRICGVVADPLGLVPPLEAKAFHVEHCAAMRIGVITHEGRRIATPPVEDVLPKLIVFGEELALPVQPRVGA